MSQNWNIQHKTILISGATSGIGKAAAIALAKKGAQIIFLARNKEKAKALLAEMPAPDLIKHVYIPCDLASKKSIQEAIQKIKGSMKKIDVLINNAATWQTNFHTSQNQARASFPLLKPPRWVS